MLDALEYMPAHRQLELFRRKRLSPVEVLNAQIGRNEEIGHRINAVTAKHFEEALKAAAESEARYQRGDVRPLEGISIAVKEEYGRRGWAMTAGSVLFKDEVSHKNHPVVDKLLAAGAILHVQTTVPELFLVGVTWSDLWGVTRNPWNPDYTPGGSSGGSAAALAAGMATLAIGSDMGGSIRIPSALCGVYGSKPAYGRIASPGPSGLIVHTTPGPLARDAIDMILLQNVMSGFAPGCPAVLPQQILASRRRAPRGYKLALSMDQGWASLDADVRANTLAAAKLLEGHGATVDEVDLPLETSDSHLRETIEKALFSTAIGADLIDLAARTDEMTTYGRRFVNLACAMGPLDAREAAKETLRLYGIIDKRVFEAGYDALITPTVATTRISADYDPTADTPVIDGKSVDPYAGWFLTSLFSLLNWMPVVSVPTGVAANNVPTGLQIACRPYDDATAAAIATFYAEAAPAMPFGRICGDRSTCRMK
jgi:Asp-tRNA(Asn)/Glu-tRNA(Gln) amidotransferase A subunit family amidase